MWFFLMLCALISTIDFVDCAIWFRDWRAASKAYDHNVSKHISCYWYQHCRSLYPWPCPCLLWSSIVWGLTFNVLQVKLSSCQRIVLLNYNKDTKLIDFRHYSIRLQPVGVSRRVRKFVQNRQVPDLRNLKDVSEFLTRYAMIALFPWIKAICECQLQLLCHVIYVLTYP